jgi:4-carboxymuconolactone decarboxylase
MAESERSEEEKRRLARAFTEALATPEEIREDWGRMIVDMVLPDGVWSRPGLSQRDRSLITVAALCALHRPNELRLHIARGLENGLSREEICEVIMHMAIYGGFPVAVEGMAVAKSVFEAGAD